MRREKPRKPYWEMTAEELAEATAEFDQEFIVDTFRPLTPREKALWQRIKRKRSKQSDGK
jgi:hypothetical protein